MSSTKGIDFARLSLKDALDLAVLVEDEARERYDEFADQMDLHRTPGAAEFFRFMSINERKHGDDLAARRKELFGDAPRTVDRTMLFEVEAPDYDEARAFMTARAAMSAALHSEEKAHAFFVAALPTISDPQVKALFEELRDEEVHHQDLVKRELAKLGAEGDVDVSDVADEPNAQ